MIDCYTAVNDIDKAESIVRERLAAEPSARLWCALGELCERSRLGKKPLVGLDEGLLSFCFPIRVCMENPIRGTHCSTE